MSIDNMTDGNFIVQNDHEGISEVFKTSEEMFASFDERFKRNHPFYNWFNELWYKNVSGGIMGYSPHVIFSDPWDVVSETGRRIKWAYQRVYRGWDDRATWGVGYWLIEYMPGILSSIKGSQYGIPATFFSDDDINMADNNAAAKKYDKVLADLIDGFNEMKQLQDFDFDYRSKKTKDKSFREYKKKEKEAKEKLKLLVEYFWEIGD